MFNKMIAQQTAKKEKLLDNCKGAAFYESKVVPVKSNAELYDILSAVINK